MAMIEIRADVELKDNIVVAMPKITREGYYVLEVFGHVLEEFPKNIGAGATKNLKKTSQTPKGIPGTDGGISNSADKGTNNVSFSNTPIGEKIDIC
ncbi:hypothetical protein Tco_0395895, partial [Tanacetum coccineum]